MRVHEVQREPGWLEWTIHRPEKRNAIDPESLGWIERRCAELRGEVVTLRGGPGTGFCAGFDVEQLEPRADGALPDAPLVAATSAMREADATFVAVLSGHCIGAGVELATSCDLRIADPSAWMQVPVGKMGVVYHAAGLSRMVAVLGHALAERLLLLGERITAAELASAGALTRLVDESADALDAAARDATARLRGAAPLGVTAHRTFLRAHLDRSPTAAPDPAFAEQWEAWRHRAYASADHAEALAARASGRAPRFRGA